MRAIRAATADDVPHLVELSRQVHELHLAAAPDRYRDPSREEVAARFREQLADSEIAILVAEVGGDVVAYVQVRRVDMPGNVLVSPRITAHVNELGVRADVHRSGHGRALMAAAEAQARAWGAAAVTLDVQGFNGDALRFYQALGYLVVANRIAKPI